MSHLMRAEKSVDGRKMETDSLPSRIFLKTFRFEFDSPLLNVYYVPGAP